jgi:uncharacterized membrane protein YjgN (DUF898 family)
MTNSPGDWPPQDPTQQPGYWEQQQAQQPYGQQPGYPVAYAPDHPKATTSLVLGILGIVVCGLVAPFAWRIGKRTRDEIDASHGQLGGRGAAQAGYVLGLIGTILLALVLVLVVLLLVGVSLVATTSTVSTSSY